MKYCQELYNALNSKPQIFFNVSGGCGVDLSLGENPCMGSSGIWFKYCPFCGREIISHFNSNKVYWDWWERGR